MFGFEIEILKFIQNFRTDFLNNFFEMVTMLGEETLMILLVSVFYFAIDKRLAYRVFFVTACSMGVNSVIKNIAKVPRPFASGEISCVRPDTATGYSFPSGHTQNFATWSTALAIRLKKWWFSVLVALLVPLVGFSRMYLGAHFPSDVIVGVVLGLAFAFFGNLIYNKFENKQKLYLALVVVFAVFLPIFFTGADEHYRDFFKFFGMISGVACAMPIENKYADMGYDVSAFKKILRVIIGVALAIAIKEGIKALNVFGMIQVTYLFDIFRYFALVVVVFGMCPILFKKLNM